MGQRTGKKKRPSIKEVGIERREEQRLIWRRAATTYRAKEKAKSTALLEEREQLRVRLKRVRRIHGSMDQSIDTVANQPTLHPLAPPPQPVPCSSRRRRRCWAS